MPGPPRKGQRRNLVATLLPIGLGVVLLVMIVTGGLRNNTIVKRPKIVYGINDEIYFTERATSEDAKVLAQALRKIGYFHDRGNTVVLAKGDEGTIVSFVLVEGAWSRADAAGSFEEIGRRIAPAVGGFPILVRLIDSARVTKKELTIGKSVIGTRDEVYYFGSATGRPGAGGCAEVGEIPGGSRCERGVGQGRRHVDLVCGG
jgi:hypothetical protein